MSEFLEILTHGRRLQGAVKDLSVEELTSVQEKLNNIIEKRKEQEAELIKAQQEKLAKLEEIKKQMEEAGIDVADLQDVAETKPKRKSGKKRPVKYKITVDGETVAWTGVGRMPVVFKDALAKGQSLEDFAI
ncbi:MAG: H-NS family nucleoid-associated regulatory protein [Pseudomonadota bacterium]|jgi:DNA-binding protein H-NS|uniref:DNA-binding protein n=2 Tax=Alteromonas TaxID=226 RepID=A0A2S9VF82_9ALTE|nr:MULTISPECIES: H-NS family nucleoid-associated regulatory protein [Alteromonas]MBR9793933.1 H-NS histone family protein [Gammaproteobacteria bacterium]MCP4865667.1 H-NS histone family protein [Alteromonas sp.]MDY6929558.1 H-NS family nucleoid-associated regulatory protein [Pseudomonadota bacterium]RPH16573.1 MAG: H-NS histone family protein [Alteromonadaceae bacterium TMED7]PRO75096.1 histone [Alteromonas alba]|tara:strand:- start:4129 stop:4524 length:396 start_codon:yes stop_codon:yes gene_type:complete